MASPDNTELEKQLVEAGNKLLQLPPSVDETLSLLDEVHYYLSRVKQPPSKSMQTALSTSMKVLVADEVLWHQNADVKVAVASCLREIIRITASDAPYDDDWKKASNAIEYGDNLVGSKVKVWWPGDNKFYEGCIVSFNPVGKKHKVVYEDGDEELLNLRDEKWELVRADSMSDAKQAAECRSLDLSSGMFLQHVTFSSDHVKKKRKVQKRHHYIRRKKILGEGKVPSPNIRGKEIVGSVLTPLHGRAVTHTEESTMGQVKPWPFGPVVVQVSHDGKVVPEEKDGDYVVIRHEDGSLSLKLGGEEEVLITLSVFKEASKGYLSRLMPVLRRRPSTFIDLGKMTNFARTMALGYFGLLLETLDTMSLPQIDVGDLGSFWVSLEVVKATGLKVEWLGERFNQLTSLVAHEALSSKFHAIRAKIGEQQSVLDKLKDMERETTERLQSFGGVPLGEGSLSGSVGQFLTG